MKPTDSKTILITGATDGIGKVTAQKLLEQNAHVIIHGRSTEKLKAAAKELSSASGNKKIDTVMADFSSLAEVRRLAEDILIRYPRIDVLINNAGAGYADPQYSKDGYELRFAVNYLAPFLLTRLLLPSLRNTAPSRIVNVSSMGQYPVNFDDIMMEKKFDPVKAYSQSKLALIMFTNELAEHLRDKYITVNSLHPGTYLNTNMVRNAGITPFGEPETGADAVVYLALSEEMEGVTGKYFNVKKEASANAQAYDKEARKKLWELSMNLLKQKKAFDIIKHPEVSRMLLLNKFS